MTGESQDTDIAEPTPDEQLAASIADTLVRIGFLDDSRKDRFSSKLSIGQVKAEDWRTLAAAAIQKPMTEGAK